MQAPVAGSQVSSVQALWSSHVSYVWTQPDGVQVSVEQGLPSSHVGGPLMHVPATQLSRVQGFPLLQSPPSGTPACTQPSVWLHESAVHWLPSSQVSGAWAQAPVEASQ
jgi:hypothetical protein